VFEHWTSLTLRDGYGLRMFKNRALRKIFGPRRVKVTEQWHRQNNGRFNDL
jgi:hypothetical protein